MRSQKPDQRSLREARGCNAACGLATSNPRRFTHRAQAMMLIEMLGAIMLLGVFSFAFAKLFYSTMTAMTATSKATAAAADRQWRPVGKVMEADVWNGLELKIESDTALLIQQAAGKSVQWRIVDHTLSRQALLNGQPEQAPQQWPVAKAPLKFAVAPGGVLLSQPSMERDPQPDIFYSSQLLLLQGGRK